MRKFTALLLLLALTFSLTACDLSGLTDGLPFGSNGQTAEDILKGAASDTTNDQQSGDSANAASTDENTPDNTDTEQLPSDEKPDTTLSEEEPDTTPPAEEEQNTPPPAVEDPQITPQFPADKPYLSLYWDAICDFKTLVQFRLSEDWEPWSKLPTLSDAVEKAVAAYTGDPEWENMISELPAYNTNTENGFGYILYDINRDKVPELFWVRQDYSILALFTCYKEKLCLLAVSHSRLPIYISDNGTFYAWGSEGAATDFCEVYTLKNDDLQQVFFFASTFDDYGDARYVEGVSGAHKFDIQEYNFNLLCRQYPDNVGDFWNSFPIYDLRHVPTEFDGGGEKEPNTNYVPYLQKVKLGDFAMFVGPGYHYDYAGSIEEPGIFTITTEIVDAEGIHWGRLKSGKGWINLDVALS